MSKQTIYLIFSLQIAPLIGDFSPLSTKWMLEAKLKGKPLLPILCHALVHASLMFVPIHIFTNYSMKALDKADLMILFQLISHFTIDVWKGRMGVWFPSLSINTNAEFWYLFGFDQFLHQCVILIMIAFCLH
jgi:hypothetical protein